MHTPAPTHTLSDALRPAFSSAPLFCCGARGSLLPTFSYSCYFSLPVSVSSFPSSRAPHHTGRCDSISQRAKPISRAASFPIRVPAPWALLQASAGAAPHPAGRCSRVSASRRLATSPPACACSPSCTPEAPLQPVLIASSPVPCHLSLSCASLEMPPTDLLPQTPLFPDTWAHHRHQRPGASWGHRPPALFPGCVVSSRCSQGPTACAEKAAARWEASPPPSHVPPRLQTLGAAPSSHGCAGRAWAALHCIHQTPLG